MAVQTSKAPKKTLLEMLEVYNISKIDLIIYSSCLFVFVVSLSMFVFFSGDLKSRQNNYRELSEDFDSSQMLKSQEDKINKEFSTLDKEVFGLRNRFLSEKQVNDLKEAVKKLAKKYGCDRIDATERSEPVDSIENFIITTKDGQKKTLKIKFRKRSMEFTFQMTLGNFFGFLKSLETSNKMIEILPFRVAQGDDKNIVRLNNFVLMVYVVPADLDKELAGLIGDVTFEDHISDVILGEKAQIVPVTEKKILVKENVKTKEGDWDIRPIFRTVEPPKPKEVVPPVELKYFMTAGNTYLFTFNNDQNSPYYGTPGGILKTRDGKTIPKYDTLKILEVTKMGFVFEMDEVTGELSKLRR
ncbi:MAG: hypothetical protein WCK36_01350 [Candidatus Firestonebacteria bacterium]